METNISVACGAANQRKARATPADLDNLKWWEQQAAAHRKCPGAPLGTPDQAFICDCDCHKQP